MANSIYNKDKQKITDFIAMRNKGANQGLEIEPEGGGKSMSRSGSQ